jgi:hypothetical protein
VVLFKSAYFYTILLFIFIMLYSIKNLHDIFFNFIKKYFLFFFSIPSLIRILFFNINFNLSFLPTYYHRNELIWVDGFLFDFLQKKSVDIWLRKFIINTGYLFSERLVFDWVVRIYLDNLVWPLHYMGLLESSNVTEMLSIILFLYYFIFSFLFIAFLLF